MALAFESYRGNRYPRILRHVAVVRGHSKDFATKFVGES